MKSLIRLVVILAILTAIFVAASFRSSPVSAQNGTPAATANPDCKPADLFKELAALTPTGNSDKDLAVLLQEADKIHLLNGTCTGLKFQGSTLSKIIGPVHVPAGNYKVTLTSTGYFNGDIQVTGGSCGKDGSTTSLFSVGSGQANAGAEILFNSKDCTILLKTSNVNAPWTLVFEPLP